MGFKNFNKKKAAFKLFSLMFIVAVSLVGVQCAKDNLTQEKPEGAGEVLTLQSKSRLTAIKKLFEQKKLETIVINKPLDTSGITWTPDWKKPSLSIVHDSVTYVFYPLLARGLVNGKLKVAIEVGQKTYLIIKNEKEFYRGTFLPKDPTKDFLLSKFTGNLRLENLEKRKAVLISYVNGAISEDYKKNSTQAFSKKSGGMSTSGWEEVCTITYNCSWSIVCASQLYVTYTEGCTFPTSQPGNQCYDPWYMTGDNAVETCEDVYVEDPPTIPDPGSGGGSDGTPPAAEQVEAAIINKPFALLNKIDCGTLRKWLATAKFTPNQSIIDKLNTIAISLTTAQGDEAGLTIDHVANVQKIDDAHSTIVNMDFYPILVTDLPVINGHQYTAPEFLHYMRVNINSFTDGKMFSPYNANGVNDVALWNSNSPTGAVVGIDLAGPDNGSVVVSYSSSDKWIFTTIHEPMYGDHPVSGNREFGYIDNHNGTYYYFTRGVDRLTTWDATVAQDLAEIPLTASNAVWSSFQTKMTDFVNSHSGFAMADEVDNIVPDWPDVKAVLNGTKPLSTLSKNCPD